MHHINIICYRFIFNGQNLKLQIFLSLSVLCIVDQIKLNVKDHRSNQKIDEVGTVILMGMSLNL